MATVHLTHADLLAGIRILDAAKYTALTVATREAYERVRADLLMTAVSMASMGRASVSLDSEVADQLCGIASPNQEMDAAEKAEDVERAPGLSSHPWQ